MSNALAVSTGRLPEMAEIEVLQRIALMACKSGLAKTRNESDAVFIVLYGNDLGIRPLIALRHIYSVNGVPTCSGELMLALMRRTGQVRISLPDPGKVTDSATVSIHRLDTDERGEFTYTMQMAADAGLAKKDNWLKHRPQMLIWRAVSMGAKMMCGDMTGGLYLIEEIAPDTAVDEEGTPITVISSSIDTEPITTNSSETRQKAENSVFDGSSGVNSSNAGETTTESAKSWIDDLAALVLPFGYDNEHHARASVTKLANGKVPGYTLQIPKDKASAKTLTGILENNAVVVMYYCADKIHGWDKAQVNAVLGAAMNEGDNPAPLKKFSEWTAAGFGLEAAWNTLLMAKEMEAEVAPESEGTDDLPW